MIYVGRIAEGIILSIWVECIYIEAIFSTFIGPCSALTENETKLAFEFEEFSIRATSKSSQTRGHLERPGRLKVVGDFLCNSLAVLYPTVEESPPAHSPVCTTEPDIPLFLS